MAFGGFVFEVAGDFRLNREIPVGRAAYGLRWYREAVALLPRCTQPSGLDCRFD